MTPADVKRRVLRSFGDTDAIFITEADIIDWINSGQLDIVKETDCITGTSTAAAASTFPANYPTGWIRTQRVLYDTRVLSPVGLEELDSKGFWTNGETGEPYFYYNKDGKINLFPLSASTDGTLVTIYYTKAPTTITVIGDALTIPANYHDQLVSYVLAEAHKRNNNLRTYQQIRSEYDRGVAQTADLEDVQDDTYPVMRDDPWESNSGNY